MLREEQVTELLRRCELITNRRLKQTRGNLRNAESRAAAILELKFQGLEKFNMNLIREVVRIFYSVCLMEEKFG